MSIFKEIVYYFRVFVKYLGFRMYIVFFLTLLAASTELFGIALLLPLIEMVDSDIAGDPTTITIILQAILGFFGIDDSMVGVLLFIAVVFSFKGVIKFAESGYQAVLAATLQKEIKGEMFRYYSNMDYIYYTSQNTGHFVNVIVTQINKLIRAFNFYKQFLSEIIITLSYMVLAFVISWQFATMAAVAGVLILGLFTTLNRYMKKLSRKQSEEMSTLNKIIVQTLQAFKYVAATAQFEHLRGGVMVSIHKLSRYSRNSGLANAFTTAIKEPVSVFVLIAIIIIQVGILDAPLGPILVSLILINRAMSHIIHIQSHWQQTLFTVGGIEMVEREFDMVQHAQESDGKVELSPFSRELELRNVTFSYDDGQRNLSPAVEIEGDGYERGKRRDVVINDLSMKVKASKTIALVGESGAGKSTLVDLMTLLLRPQSGEIYIDGIQYHDVNLLSWRRQIGFVSQDTVVFDDTIANNICLWKGDYRHDPELMAQIEEAAERAFVSQFVKQLPDGFNTVVGDRGVRLSGGQKQRLFIARELFKKPKFLILDEATSALDSESELYIKESIDSLQGQTTMVIIAHRLSTIRNADHIYVMDNGKIVEHGTYDELIQSRKMFRKMVDLQAL